jgi:glycosyltransferase involved in cell wall biosynthesis
MAATLGTPRIAITLEQCWHDVPGGTATSVLNTVAALARRTDVQMIGVSARHSNPPSAAFTPAIDVKALPLPRIALYESWQRLRWPAVQRATGRVDVIHATTFAIPPKSAPLVVTVHDLAFLHAPEHFTPRGVRFFKRGLDLTHREADLIVVPSRSTYDDCIATGLPAERLRLIPHGVVVPHVSDDDVERFRVRHGITRPYVLWSGTLEPRKNLPALLAAFGRLRKEQPDIDLVLVGPSGWGDVEVPLDETAHVKPLGFLPTAELHAAYAGAAVFCYPSIREGFGLPVLEAMAHAVPVVTSAGTAMAEFADGAGILVDPHDVEGLTTALSQALGPENERLRTAARERAAEYTWERAAALTAQAYRELLSTPRS